VCGLPLPQVCGLINSLNYCEAVVKDWGEQLFFIQLRQGEILVGDSEDYARADAEPTQECADPNDTVFDGAVGCSLSLSCRDVWPFPLTSHWDMAEVVLHYRGLRNDITGMMMDVVLQSFKALTGPYISKKYHAVSCASLLGDRADDRRLLSWTGASGSTSLTRTTRSPANIPALTSLQASARCYLSPPAIRTEHPLHHCLTATA